MYYKRLKLDYKSTLYIFSTLFSKPFFTLLEIMMGLTELHTLYGVWCEEGCSQTTQVPRGVVVGHSPGLYTHSNQVWQVRLSVIRNTIFKKEGYVFHIA